MTKEEASPSTSTFREQGNAEFRSGNYLKSAALYTRAIKEDPECAVLYSNRSAALLHINKVSKALVDAEQCVRLSPDWDKSHFRKGAALEAMGMLEEVRREGVAVLMEFLGALGALFLLPAFCVANTVPSARPCFLSQALAAYQKASACSEEPNKQALEKVRIMQKLVRQQEKAKKTAPPAAAAAAADDGGAS